MKKNKILLLTILVLVLVTAGLAAVHFMTRPQVPGNSLLVIAQGKETTVDFDTLPVQRAEGVLVNGKGEEKKVEADAVSLADVLKAAGIDPLAAETVVLTAADEYTASYSGSEVNEPGRVFLMKEENGTITAFIFGDQNAKRRIHDVNRAEVK